MIKIFAFAMAFTLGISQAIACGSMPKTTSNEIKPIVLTTSTSAPITKSKEKGGK